MPTKYRQAMDAHVLSQTAKRAYLKRQAELSAARFSTRPQGASALSSPAELGEAGDQLMGSKGLGDLAGPLEPEAAYEAADRKLRRSVGTEPATNTSNFNRREPV